MIRPQKIIKITSLILFLFCSVVRAQVSGYAFSEVAGTYNTITGTVVHASGWTDPTPVNVTIPFTFTFDNVGYTSCSVNGNGYITFGATASAANLYTPISAATAYSGAVSGLGLDLVSSSSTVVYGTTGTAPNRVFIVQWNACRRSANNAVGADWNFQIQLLETSNVVKVVYGACAATNTTATINAEIGLRGANNTDYHNRFKNSASSWAGTTITGFANNNTVLTRNTSLPPSGRTFIWTPPSVTNSCDPNGNVVIYSNYDGGILNINVDQNIPNLKIGVCTYEGTTINLSGTYVGNVTAVYYAGFNASNAHCSGIINTSINGVPPGITSISIYPAATMADPNGNPNIDCSYQCTTGNQGGCNTVGQVAHYFLTQFGGGSLRFHYTQYGCWTGTRLISAGGNCCLVNQVLPVELEYFSAQCAGNSTILQWETASETNNRFFTIERSTDGSSFQAIAQINGAGTSSQHHSYTYTDEDLISETTYYRLRQTDWNGQTEVFPVRVLDRQTCMAGTGDVVCFPNPANDQLVMQLTSNQGGPLAVYWTDVRGRQIRMDEMDVHKGMNTFVFDISTFPAGTYILDMQGTIALKQNHVLIIKR